ncbi:hypothetical protein EVAR_95885_1 [Eumeta japonica]|uniref:Uncharacterized protein n=1 Tax=Eumeta variegata TaxID=151549 RepID=A0A4C1TI85_EUMVA|nr:hypothetical protein EVAR_95885_1 [Eumeta japonica]
MREQAHRAGRKNIACSNVCLHLRLTLPPDRTVISRSLVYRHNYSNICPNDVVKDKRNDFTVKKLKQQSRSPDGVPRWAPRRWRRVCGGRPVWRASRSAFI